MSIGSMTEVERLKTWDEKRCQGQGCISWTVRRLNSLAYCLHAEGLPRMGAHNRPDSGGGYPIPHPPPLTVPYGVNGGSSIEKPACLLIQLGCRLACSVVEARWKTSWLCGYHQTSGQRLSRGGADGLPAALPALPAALHAAAPAGP